MSRSPLVTIGMPVFNGADFLASTVESILGQTLADIRLLIADNASTDGTEEICRSFVIADDRVSYVRHPRNLGVAPNLNYVFRPEGARYFKWAGHDDLLAPTYLERCVALLEDDPRLVIAHSLAYEIDGTGSRVRTYDDDIRLDAPRPHERLWRVLWIRSLNELYGVMRVQAVNRTHMMGSFVNHDRNLVAEMLMLGGIGYVNDHLFERRMHVGGYTGVSRGLEERTAWQDTEARPSRLPSGAVNVRWHLRAALTMPTSLRERAACSSVVLEWAARRAFEQATGRGDEYRERVARGESSQAREDPR